MYIDLTLQITPQILATAAGPENKALFGHVGTHFDVMDKEFPLDYTRRKGIVFDVSGVCGRDIQPADIDLSLVEEGMFVAFWSGYSDRVEYGASEYFKAHPQLSEALIDGLLLKGVSIIGIDFGGIRRGAEHIPADQRCADRGVFVIENLRNLPQVLRLGGRFTACTYPVRATGMTGLPCRVIAEL